MAVLKWGGAAMALLGAVAGAAGAQETADETFTKGRPVLMVETGPVWSGSNTAQIPRDTGTRFNLRGLTGSGPFANVRLTLLYPLNRRNGLRFVYAPLRYSGTGALGGTTAFAGQSFAPATPTEGIYQFNSYRATYYWNFHRSARAEWRAGLTLKVRDARIALVQNGVSGSDYDLGLVPLAHVSGSYRFAPRWNLLVDFDGLAAPQGRAFDLALQAAYDVGDGWSAFVGYRTLEGGANVKQVYNFAWFNYLSLGVARRF